ncbi:MAG: leucine-rich repeat domain-containing protein [Bacteroidaceae bacterium]|nr:leucine-rich repeat domain-containing protein [Bacteroidaceae bacterium]
MKRICSLFILALVAISSFAHDIEIDGIFYNLVSKGKQAIVTFKGEKYDSYSKEYSGSVIIPSTIAVDGVTYSVISIGENAFFVCSSLTSVTIPNSVTSIGGWAFCDCSGLTSVTIPNSVTSIGGWAFYNCSGLTSITIPNSVTSIGGGAFEGCSGLTSVTIPNSVTSIGNYAFSGCSGLTSITVENGNPNYDSRDNCNAIIETSTNTLKSGCQNTIIPNSVTSIGEMAFLDCSGLTSVTIPNSVKSIGDYAFNFCTGLKEIHCQAVTPPAAYTSTFEGISKNDCKLYVPTGTKGTYASAKVWKEFINIIEEGTTAITLSETGDKYGDVDFYTLNGVRVDAPNKSGIYVVKKKGETKMVVVKK